MDSAVDMEPVDSAIEDAAEDSAIEVVDDVVAVDVDAELPHAAREPAIAIASKADNIFLLILFLLVEQFRPCCMMYN